MQPKLTIISFLSELIQRLFTKSPLFFKIWSGLSTVLILITGLPDFINLFVTTTGAKIPDLWNAEVTLIVRYASAGMLFMSVLSTQSKPTYINADGGVNKITDPKQLPFTAASEQKQVETSK
jgi:hypothetical protein